VSVNFAELKKKFDDPYTHEEYDLSEVLASVDSPFLVYEMSLLASGHIEFGMRLRDAAVAAGDCDEGEATVCHALRCLAERLFIGPVSVSPNGGRPSAVLGYSDH
jgi:hypothetical protein